MPELYLLDTCVISDTDERVEAWLQTVDDDCLYLSVASIMEQCKGIELLRPRKPEVAAQIQSDLDEVLANLSDRVISIDAMIAGIWGSMLAKNPQRNRTNVCMDAAIAASAAGRFWIATNNVDDFRGLGLDIINPFRDPAEKIKIEDQQ